MGFYSLVIFDLAPLVITLTAFPTAPIAEFILVPTDAMVAGITFAFIIGMVRQIQQRCV